MSNLFISPPSLFIGETISSGTAGSILFSSSTTGLLQQDNANLFYDLANAQFRSPTLYGGTASSSILTIGANTVTFDPANTGRIQITERINFNSLAYTTSAQVNTSILTATGVASSSANSFQFPFIKDDRTFKYSVSQLFSTAATLFANGIITPTANAISDVASNYTGFLSNTNFKVDVGAGNAATTATVLGYISSPRAGPRVSGSGTITEFVGYSTWNNNFFTSDVYANNTVTTATHFKAADLANSGTVTNHQVLLIPNIVAGTNIYGINSALASAANKFFIYHSGTADSVHTGNLALGSVTAPTALIDMAGGQANHIRMAGHTADPASPTDGDIWYHTTRENHSIKSMMGVGGLVNSVNVATADSSAIASTTTETVFSGGFSIPANSLSIGTVIRSEWSGIYSTTGSPTLNFRIRYGTTGGVAVVTFGAITGGTSVANFSWRVMFTGIIRTIGASGTLAGNALIFLNNGATETVTGAVVTKTINTTVTIDTTATTVLNLSLQWSASSASNTATRINQHFMKSAS